MNIPSATPAPQTMNFQNEWEMFKDLVMRLSNGILNRVFALTIQGSRRRRAALWIMVILLGVLLSLGYQGFSQWLSFLRVFIQAMLTGEPTSREVFTIFLRLVLDAKILRLLPILILPFIVSREFASRYLADIFELDEDIEEVKIARKFVNEVSLGGADNQLTVNVDTFDSDETKKSPIRRIGGPGRVRVALGTAILVERPDGRPRVIGPLPTKDEQGDKPVQKPLEKQVYRKGNRWHVRFKQRPLLSARNNKPAAKPDKYVLEGFERIREPVDLRVQMPEALEISARSRDGIPIKVIDARVVFSIVRGIRPPTVKEPYPYTEDAIHAMIYQKPNRVMQDDKSPSVWETQTATMKTLLREEMREFMGRHELGEYLASIGQPETESINEMEKDISTEKQKISGLETHPSRIQATSSQKKPRSELSKLFSDFNGNFNQEQKKRGVEAQWVGVGTWKMPPGIPEKVIPQRHLTAWQITLENLRRGSDQELEELELNAQAEGVQRMILQVPIHVHKESENPGSNLVHARFNLIKAYRQQLNEEIQNCSRLGSRVPPSMVAADFKLMLTYSHLAYPNIPAFSSGREKKLYGELLKRVKIPQAIEKLVALERSLAPSASRADLLERIKDAWDDDLK